MVHDEFCLISFFMLFFLILINTILLTKKDVRFIGISGGLLIVGTLVIFALVSDIYEKSAYYEPDFFQHYLSKYSLFHSMWFIIGFSLVVSGWFTRPKSWGIHSVSSIVIITFGISNVMLGTKFSVMGSIISPVYLSMSVFSFFVGIVLIILGLFTGKVFHKERRDTLGITIGKLVIITLILVLLTFVFSFIWYSNIITLT